MEHDTQFLARMIVATRESHQITSRDAQRLSNIATFGDSLPRGDSAVGATTMPEERRPQNSDARSPEQVIG
jgi:hypothetical protein